MSYTLNGLIFDNPTEAKKFFQTRQSRKYRIARDGMGGFLSPPSHPEHFVHIQVCSKYAQFKNADCYSIGSLLEPDKANDPYIPAGAITAAKRLMKEWEEKKPGLDNPETQDWILQVLGYFRSCYIPASGSRNASDLEIVHESLEPVYPWNRHAGVALIRDYYPDYQPKPEDFKQAYWGSKPQ